MALKQSLLLFSVSLLLSLNSFSQIDEALVKEIANSGDEKEIVKYSSVFMMEGYMSYSEILVDKLLEINHQSANYLYKKGILEMMLRNNYTSAINYFEKAISNTDKYYDIISVKEESATTDIYFHLATCYHMNQEFDKAIEYYSIFLDESYKRSGLLTESEIRIQQCKNAKELISNPSDLIVKSIRGDINTENPEYSPIVSLDGTEIFFTSRRKWEYMDESLKDPIINFFPEDIYVSNFGDSSWITPVRLDFCQPERNEATVALSTDQSTIYMYGDSLGNGDLYYTDYFYSQFKDFTHVEHKQINSKYWETHCTISHDRESFYFVSNRPGGYGGRDIYVVNRINDTTWSEPINLGSGINSSNDEDAPFITVDNEVLYFASNGPKSIGGFDILRAERNEDGTFTEALNMGYPLNTTHDDIFFTSTVDGSKGYFSSFRPGGKGEKDIYEVYFDEPDHIALVSSLRGGFKMLDGSKVSADFSAKLVCVDCDTKNQEIPLRIRNGQFMTILDHCKQYKLAYYDDKNKQISSETFNTVCTETPELIEKHFYIGAYELAGTITDDKTKQGLSNATIELIDPINKKVLETIKSDASGKYVSNYLANKKFGEKVNILVKVTADDHFEKTENLETVLGKDGKVVLDYALTEWDLNTKIQHMLVVNTIYYNFDHSNIRKDAATTLDSVVVILNQYPEIAIELASHTDCRGSKKYNLKLSNQRAYASAQYIKKRISNPERVTSKGYGESRLSNQCDCKTKNEEGCTKEDHQKNRRTEFNLIVK